MWQRGGKKIIIHKFMGYPTLIFKSIVVKLYPQSLKIYEFFVYIKWNENESLFIHAVDK